MGVRRLTGVNVMFEHPNALAATIVTTLPLLYFLWRRRHELGEAWPRSWQASYKYGLIAYGTIAVSSLILTNSRSGFVTAIFFVFLATLGKKGVAGKMGAVVLAAMLLITTWFLLPEDSQNRLRTLWNPEAGPASAQLSAEGRIAGLNAGLAMYSAYPVLGVGVGNFGAYRRVHVDGDYHEAHNLLGQVLGEVGTLGLLTFAFIVGAILANCAKTRRLSYKGGQTAAVLADFAVACRNTTLILLFLGLGSHNMMRYTWLWTAAFALVALWLSQELKKKGHLQPAATGVRPDLRSNRPAPLG